MRGQLHHVEVNVSSLGKSRRFWSWFLGRLGYRQYQEWKGGFSWKLGRTYIVFVQTRRKYLKTRNHRSATGLNHLPLQSQSRQDAHTVNANPTTRGTQVLCP